MSQLPMAAMAPPTPTDQRTDSLPPRVRAALASLRQLRRSDDSPAVVGWWDAVEKALIETADPPRVLALMLDSLRDAQARHSKAEQVTA